MFEHLLADGPKGIIQGGSAQNLSGIEQYRGLGSCGAKIGCEQMIADRPLTFGGKAVGLAFNPSGDPHVARCKEQFANIIDQLHVLRSGAASAEVKRLASVAITEAQTAQMWAVKALTWRD